MKESRGEGRRGEEVENARVGMEKRRRRKQRGEGDGDEETRLCCST